jgi:hypothetical protein
LTEALEVTRCVGADVEEKVEYGHGVLEGRIELRVRRIVVVAHPIDIDAGFLELRDVEISTRGRTAEIDVRTGGLAQLDNALRATRRPDVEV